MLVVEALAPRQTAPSLFGRLLGSAGSDALLQGERAEIVLVTHFVAHCATIDPALCPTATGLLQDEWIVKHTPGDDSSAQCLLGSDSAL
jgi:hypothetical protein